MIGTYLTANVDEVALYTQSGKLVTLLSTRHSNKKSLPERMIELSETMADCGFWKIQECDVIKAWIQDLLEVGYKFPGTAY